MDSKKSNKIREIVRLQQILKKWKKLANTSNNGGATNTTTTTTTTQPHNTTTSSGGGSKSIKFLKRTLSFTDMTSSSSSSSPCAASEGVVPKGFVAVCVGKELKRFIIPMEYLGHQVFGFLLRKAEEEFGFQQEGVLKIPCEVPMFEKILKVVQNKQQDVDLMLLHEFGFNIDKDIIGCYDSPDCEFTPNSHHPQLCR